MDLQATSTVDDGQILSLLTVEELKKSKRISHSMEDDFLEDCILTAYAYFDGIDGWLRRSILPRTYVLKRATLPESFELPIGPLVAVGSISALNSAQTAYTTVASTVYLTVNGHVPTVSLIPGQSWPSLEDHPQAAQIQFTAGWALADVPRGVRAAIRLLAGSLYDHREADFEDQRVSYVSRKIEYGMERFAGRYRVLNDSVDPA
jgi:hypothetical protein